jgi:hypothetical protein
MRISSLVLASITSLLLAAADGGAQPADKHDDTAEDWALEQFRHDLPVDFFQRQECKEPDKEYSCRLLSSDIITKILSNNMVGQHGIRITHAVIVGNVDLADTEIVPAFYISNSVLFGDLIIDDSHIRRNFSIQKSTVDGKVSSSRVLADAAITLSIDTFTKLVKFDNAKIDGDLDIRGSNFKAGFDASHVNVTGNLQMSGTRIDRPTDGPSIYAANLSEARVDGNLHGEYSSLQGLNADVADVKGNMLLDNSILYNMHLADGRIGGSLQMTFSKFIGDVLINSMDVHENVFMRSAIFENEVNFVNTKIGGNLEMTGATFYGIINARRASVNGSLFLQDAQFWREVTFAGAKVANFVKLDHVGASRVDLSDATASQLLLSDVRWRCARPTIATSLDDDALVWDVPYGVHWPLSDKVSCKDPPALNLRNFHVADFEGDENAWPPAMDLEGFQYDRLVTSAGMRAATLGNIRKTSGEGGSSGSRASACSPI